MTKTLVTLADQSEMAYLPASNKFRKMTSQIINVDGGLQEAFLR